MRPTSSRGGARPGAGRPRTRRIPSEPHKMRPTFPARRPVEVTARVVAPGNLRTRRFYGAVRRAVRTSLARADFRIVELVVRARAVVLVVEADDAMALARGVQGFEVAAARYLNRAARRRGTVFPDRYRAVILATRAAVRAALSRLGGRRRVCTPETWLLRIDGRDPGQTTSSDRAWKPP